MSYDYVDLRHLTNGDLVRRMPDEELAKTFARNCHGRVCVSGQTCEECWLDWLKQEAT